MTERDELYAAALRKLGVPDAYIPTIIEIGERLHTPDDELPEGHLEIDLTPAREAQRRSWGNVYDGEGSCPSCGYTLGSHADICYVCEEFANP